MKDAATTLARSAAPAAALARSGRRKKRFLLLSTAALAALGVAMGVSFLDSSGTASVSIQPGSTSSLVTPLTTGGSGTTSLPVGTGSSATISGPLTTTAFSGASALTGCTGTVTQASDSSTSGATCTGTPSDNQINDSAIVNPSWSPVAGSAGTVTKAGDLAIVDATTAPNYVTVNMYLSNLAALAVDYSSFAFPISVYKTTCDGNGACGAWTVELATPYYTYLTDTSGALTFNLPTGYYYDIVMEGTNHTGTSPTGAPNGGNTPSGIGGSFYTTQTGGTNGSLSPSFYFSASES